MVMGLDLVQNRRDRRIGLDHGGIHLLMQGFRLLDQVGARFFARIVRLLHLLHDILDLRDQIGIGCLDRLVGLFQLRFFGIGEKSSCGDALSPPPGGGPEGGGALVGGSIGAARAWTREQHAEREMEKCFHVIKEDSTVAGQVSQ